MESVVSGSLASKISDKSAVICVVGLGYIGLPTSAILAKAGFSVIGYDVNSLILDSLSSGCINIAETGLSELVSEVVASKQLCASKVVPDADIYILAVPTPSNDDKSPDLSCVSDAASLIGSHVTKNSLVILESTVPPHTCDGVVSQMINSESGLVAGQDYFLAHCPERVIPGKIIHELAHNDRIVGGITPESAELAAELYRTFVTGEVLTTSATTAEICKLAENTYRDINIAYANELANICRKFKVDPLEVIEMANRHPRVNILQPGIGVGGHCIAVDPWFLVHSAPEIAKLIRCAREVNDARPAQVAEEILHSAIPGEPIVLLGLTYKPDVDDIRESPAVEVCRIVAEHWDSEVWVIEPHIKELPKELMAYNNMRLFSEVSNTLEDASHYCLVNHSIFNRL